MNKHKEPARTSCGLFVYAVFPRFTGDAVDCKYEILLVCIIDLAQHEISIINNGGISDWWFNHLEGVILPEAEELLKYILEGQLFLKYGKDQRRLVSTYAIIEWIKPVEYTLLGILIRRLQDKIDAQE